MNFVKSKLIFINNCMQKDSKLIAEAYFKKLSEGMSVRPASDDQYRDEDEQTVDMDVQELSRVIKVVANSNLSPVVKKNIEQLLRNNNVVGIYKQTKGVTSAGVQDADTVNLQAGSVSEPGSPSATGYAPGQGQ